MPLCGRGKAASQQWQKWRVDSGKAAAPRWQKWQQGRFAAVARVTKRE